MWKWRETKEGKKIWTERGKVLSLGVFRLCSDTIVIRTVWLDDEKNVVIQQWMSSNWNH